jgi:hypothetical protein
MKYLKKFENYASYEEARQNLILPNVSFCEQENEVYYNPYVDPYNGHAYVDLGLPSGTKWATMNVGATKPEEYGLYFAWGDTQGYTASQVGSGEGQKAFAWADYKWSEDGGTTMSKYNATDGKTILDIEDDAVAVAWGGSWKTPTAEQFQELIDNTEKRWTSRTVENTTVNGYEFAKSGDATFSGDTLFIPAAGDADRGGIYNVGKLGGIWSSSLYSSSDGFGLSLYFSSGYGASVYNLSVRCNGYSVRGVVG